MKYQYYKFMSFLYLKLARYCSLTKSIKYLSLSVSYFTKALEEAMK